MYRALILAAFGAILALIAFSPTEAQTQQKRGPSRKSEEAAKWLAATGDRFSLSLEGCGYTLVFVTDPRVAAAGPQGTIFLLSADEAATIVQMLVDCGMWGRSDQLPLGPLPPGRYLTVGPSDTQQAAPWWWHLGDCSDDVGAMVIVQHLLNTFKGERERALTAWLSHGRSNEKKPA